nr:molybdopterin-dependent oxidoreductase [Halomonas sp. 1513]
MLERNDSTPIAIALRRLAAGLLAGIALPAAALPAPEATPVLYISGDIAHPNVGEEAHIDRSLFADLPRHTLDTATVVTDGVSHFEGVLMRDLLDAVGAEGDKAVATALNDYIIDIPMQDFHQFDVLLADTMDGETLTAQDKGPLWIVYPRDDHSELQDIRYDYRWVWQLERLEIR